MRQAPRPRRGLALLLVVSILAIVAVITVSFVFAMRLEMAAAANFRAAIQAQYLAEAGINHARALLRLDARASSTDDLTESWATLLQGSDVDANGDRQPDARWFAPALADPAVTGRYAVLIQDEAGKINLHTAGLPSRSPLTRLTGWSPADVSLEAAFSELGLANAQALAAAVLAHRYGPDGQPGAAGADDNQNRVVLTGDGIDNDGDGVVDESDEGVDEPEEFSAAQPAGDDQPLASIDELRRLPGFDEATVNRLRDAVTFYATDRNTTLQGQPRLHLPTATPEELLQTCVEAGVANPWQKVVNILDAADSDLALSRVTRVALRLAAAPGEPQGGWRWQGGAYVNDQPNGAPRTWTWGAPDGEYTLIVYALSAGQRVGDVTVEGLTQPAMEHGETFTVTPDRHVRVTGGTISVTVRPPAAGGSATFTGLDLVPTQAVSELPQVPVRGIEAVRINEVMVKPVITLATRSDQAPGGDWTWSGTGYLNQTPGGGSVGGGRWTWSDLPNGNYYLTVHTGGLAAMVGDVEVNGLRQEHLRDGDRFTRTETISINGGTLRVNIQHNEESGYCAVSTIELSQQPDAEYVELVNVSDRPIDLGGWSLAGPGITGWPAIIPLGTTIAPHRVLVLAADQRDGADGISGNGISLQASWGSVPATQLQFTRSVTPRDDLFKDAPGTGETITVRDASGHLVDEVEYTAGQVASYIALEKGDPTVIGDLDNDGVDDRWHLSEDPAGGTPGAGNQNGGMVERIGEEELRHTIEEITVENHPPASVGYLRRVPSGDAWRTLPLADIARLADQLTVAGHRLECDGHATDPGGWRAVLRSAPLTTWFESRAYGDIGTWRWDHTDGLANGTYTLKLYGQEGEELACSIHLADGTWTPWTPPLQPDGYGRVVVGQVAIGLGTPSSTPDRMLEVRVRNDARGEISHLNWVSLAPQAALPGVININTAPRAVLMALPGMTAALAEAIIAGRPYGNRNGKQRGIGDLLLSTALGSDEALRLDAFAPLANLITTRSNVFQLLATGQTLDHGRTAAEKRIRTVIER